MYFSDSSSTAMSDRGPFRYITKYGLGVDERFKGFRGFIRETTDIFKKSTRDGRWFGEIDDAQSFEAALQRLQHQIYAPRYTYGQRADARSLLQQIRQSVPRLSDLNNALHVINVDESARRLIWGGTLAVVKVGTHHLTIIYIQLSARIGNIRRIIRRIPPGSWKYRNKSF
jgi:hypothetical protein